MQLICTKNLRLFLIFVAFQPGSWAPPSLCYRRTQGFGGNSAGGALCHAVLPAGRGWPASATAPMLAASHLLNSPITLPR